MRTLTGCRRSSQDAGEELNNFTRENTSPGRTSSPRTPRRRTSSPGRRSSPEDTRVNSLETSPREDHTGGHLAGCTLHPEDIITREKTSPDAGEVQHETNLAGGLEELNQQPPRTFTDADLTRDLETLHRMPRHLTECGSSRVMPRHLTGCGGMITRTERNRRGRRHPGNLTKTLQNLTEPLTPNRPERNQPERRRRGHPGNLSRTYQNLSRTYQKPLTTSPGRSSQDNSGEVSRCRPATAEAEGLHELTGEDLHELRVKK